MCFTLNTKWIINEHSGYKHKSMICFRWIKGNHKWERVLFCNSSKAREIFDVIGCGCVNLLCLLRSYTLTQTPLSQKRGCVLQTPVTRDVTVPREQMGTEPWNQLSDFPKTGRDMAWQGPESKSPLPVTSIPSHNCNSYCWSSNGTWTKHM